MSNDMKIVLLVGLAPTAATSAIVALAERRMAEDTDR